MVLAQMMRAFRVVLTPALVVGSLVACAPKDEKVSVLSPLVSSRLDF